MKIIDKRFNHATITMLEKMIGKAFNKYCCDPFVFTPSVEGIVGIYIDDAPYKLTNNIEVLDYYGENEDVAVYKLESCNQEDIKSQQDEGQFITTPVNSIIDSITIINENQQLYYNQEQTYNVFTPRAIIFHFEDKHEIMFEKDIWFSERIIIYKGYNLKEKLSSTDEFLESWDDSPGYSPKCVRDEIIIK